MMHHVCLCREVQSLEAQAGSGLVESGVSESQPGVVASTALIEKILSEEPRWQGKNKMHFMLFICGYILQFLTE